MKYQKHSETGFSLIEVILVVLIIGILSLIIYSSMNTEMQIIDSFTKKIEMQQQAHFIFGFMEDKIITSERIIYVEDLDSCPKTDTIEQVNIRKIIFKNSLTNDGNGYVFNLSKDKECEHYNLKYGKYKTNISVNGSVEVGNYIKSIEIIPLPYGRTYTNAEGISMNISFIINTSEVKYEKSFYFRNSIGAI